ncbi:MAG: PBP1A family penicillin-binding protein [Lachnospiraceae bacterium]|nr:PBP1A family penicillin-binding protein [Lachnospiraceae bacterium]
MKKGQKKKHRKLWAFLKFQIFLMVLILGGVAFYYLSGYGEKVSALKTEASKYVSESTVDTFKSTETSIAYDVNDQVISVMRGEKDVYYVESQRIPTYCKQAIISIEDKKFYKHHGVDFKAIVRAAWTILRDGKVSQGGSTITQQLARTIFLNRDKTWERKVEEIYIALALEEKYSKDQILEFYLNNIYFANGFYGIEAASKGYFNKSINQLSLSEIAFLCAIPNNPSNYDPYQHFDHTLTRRNRILKNMLEDGVISEASYNEAVTQAIYLESATEVSNDNAETYLFYCATRALMELEGFTFRNEFADDEDREAYEAAYSEAYDRCNRKLFTGGYRIYTSLSLEMQAKLQETVDSHFTKYQETNDEGVYKLQAAAVCLDNNTGLVRAIVGGRKQNIPGYTLNRAYQSFRQPGSTIKPLVVYLPSIENGLRADDIVVDEKIEGGPSNADGTYMGEISVRTAVALSRNTVAYRLFEKLTPQVGLSYLEAMDFAQVDASEETMAAALGGLTHGVSILEMVKGYATIENDGNYREPTCIIKITDSAGNVLYQADRTETVVYKMDASRQMTDILESVLTEGTAKGYALEDMPCAGKTGTTNDNKDSWFIGYTRYYTTGIWVGYDMPQTLPNVTVIRTPMNIWKEFMTEIHQGLAPIDFIDPMVVETPENTEEAEEETVTETTEVVEETSVVEESEDAGEAEGEELLP